jgi:hypothetical protein
MISSYRLRSCLVQFSSHFCTSQTKSCNSSDSNASKPFDLGIRGPAIKVPLGSSGHDERICRNPSRPHSSVGSDVLGNSIPSATQSRKIVQNVRSHDGAARNTFTSFSFSVSPESVGSTVARKRSDKYGVDEHSCTRSKARCHALSSGSSSFGSPCSSSVTTLMAWSRAACRCQTDFAAAIFFRSAMRFSSRSSRLLLIRVTGHPLLLLPELPPAWLDQMSQLHASDQRSPLKAQPLPPE